jgi:hypothetical protein
MHKLEHFKTCIQQGSEFGPVWPAHICNLSASFLMALVLKQQLLLLLLLPLPLL